MLFREDEVWYVSIGSASLHFVNQAIDTIPNHSRRIKKQLQPSQWLSGKSNHYLGHEQFLFLSEALIKLSSGHFQPFGQHCGS